MDLTWVTIIFFYSGLCGVSAYVPHRYHFVNDLKNRTEAQKHCRQIYTDLATINNMEEMKKLNTTLSAVLNSSESWFGLERVQNTSWQWSLADKIFYMQDTYKNWNDGEPNNARKDEFCVATKFETGKWFDDSCDNQYTFVCYDENITARFIFINKTKIWYEAQTYCRQYHTDLASVRNFTDSQQVWDLSNKSTNSHFWIGLFNDSWQWSDRSLSSFRYWSSGPNTLPQIQNYAAISVTDQGYWHNLSCETLNPFICHENKLKLVQQNLTWREALRYCRENHVDLVSVHSEEIQLWVKEVAEKASTEHVWVGLRHTCTLSFWFWESGESICYENWAPGNGTGGEDCSPVERTGAVQSGGQQQWVSLPETHTLNFICIIYED